ncbi:DNA polymerase IV [Mesorhizobium sp. LSHC424B00]|nr:DNA polymerase IV [Mesorhizobium sp. LSHC424B00]ESX54438.1 DNA polymerase IV [Mesorhizobium sp. LSHC424B00]
MEPTILHADLDAFYASVEQLLDPALRGKPIAVGGGVVLAASYEARVFGVRGGMPGRRARELCPGLIFVGGHFADYQRLGDAAITVLDDFTPLVERISIDEAFADVAGCTHLFGPPAEIAATVRRRVRAELGLPISIGVARTKHLAKIASQVAKPDGLVVVDPDTELAFLHDLPVGLMWGVGPATRARLAEIGIEIIGQLAKTHGGALRRLLGPAAGEKLSSLAWNRDPRKLETHRRSHSAGAQSALGRRPAEARIFGPVLLHLADRVASRLRAKSRPGRTVTVRVRFADLHAVTRSLMLEQPISATAMLAEIAGELVRGVLAANPREKTISLLAISVSGELVRGVLAANPREKTISLLAISVSQLEESVELQLELPLGLADEKQRPGSRQGLARFGADRAIDKIRQRFGREAVGYGAVALEARRSVPDAFRELAEKEL